VVVAAAVVLLTVYLAAQVVAVAVVTTAQVVQPLQGKVTTVKAVVILGAVAEVVPVKLVALTALVKAVTVFHQALQVQQ
jgi:hypothetical protein